VPGPMTGFVGEVRRAGNGLLLRVSVIAAIGGLLFGYDPGVISGALLFIKTDLHAGAFAQQAIVSGLLLGAIVGAVASGYLADAISRKWTKVSSGTVYVIGALGCALAVLGIYFTSASAALQAHAPYVALAALLVFIASFAIGLGPVFWLMISEIFPVGVRSTAMSVSTVVNWAANFLVAATFLTLSGAITQQGTFYLYTGIAVIALVFFLLKVPETKGRSLEEIQQDLAGART
jgi:MFS family permease